MARPPYYLEAEQPEGTRNPYDEEYLRQLESLRPTPPPAATYPVPAAPQPDPALAEALAKRDQSDAAALLMDAAGYFNRAGGGSAPANMGDSVRQTRNDSINDLVRQRAVAAEQTKQAEEERKRRIELALENPESPESLQAWDVIGRTTIGKRVPSLAEAKGKLPGKYAPGARDLLAGEIDLAKAQIKNDASVDDPQQTQAAIDQFAQIYGKENPRVLQIAEAARAEPDPKMKMKWKDAMEGELRRSQGQTNFTITNARLVDQFGQSQTQQEHLRFADRGVGGFDFDPKNPPSESQARDFSSQVAAADTVRSGIRELRAKFQTNGPEYLFGPGFEDTKVVLNDVRTRAKEAYKLGVLNGQDFTILSSIIPDPNTLKSGLVPEGFLASLDAAERRLNDAVSRTAYRYKYLPMGDTMTNPPAPTPAKPKPAAAAGKIKVSDGKETMWIDPADEAEAARDNFKRVR